MEKHSTALRILAAALVLGITGDLLLRYIPWGINVLAWTALLIGAAVIAGRPIHKGAAIACLLLAAGIAWRDSPLLLGIDVVLLLFFLPMLALGARGVRVAAAGLADVTIALATTAAQTVAGFPQLLISDLAWSRVPRGGFRTAGVAARGTFIAAPALVVFGTLLSSADPAFGRTLSTLVSFDFLSHALISVLIAAVCAGFLRSVALSGPMPQIQDEGLVSLPASETNFALLLINLLFATFVAVQFRYFFRGAGMTPSEYARRGFFELVWVVALVLPMLLLLEWLIRKEQVALFRAMAGVQVALVFVIAASALRRMQLYRDEYGLTRLRVFTTAFMIWIAALLLWFALTVLTGKRHRFAAGVLTTAIATVVVLHAINPDALIVETNLARAREGRRALDAEYLMDLSDDATPAILANARAFPDLKPLLGKERTLGWRTWNLARARAIEAIRDYESKATPPIGRP